MSGARDPGGSRDRKRVALPGECTARAMARGAWLGVVLLVGVVLVAIVFSLFHLPNPLLAIVTFVGGMIWAAVYQRQPNLFALALSHALSSLTLALVISSKLLESLRVGFKYFG